MKFMGGCGGRRVWGGGCGGGGCGGEGVGGRRMWGGGCGLGRGIVYQAI